MKKEQKPEILGIGNPLLDQIIPISDHYLSAHKLKRGSSEPIDYGTLSLVIANSKTDPVYTAGGCAANTIKGLSCLGQTCALFGKIGNDEAGKLLIQGLEKLGIQSLLKTIDLPTGRVLCLITPDHERTMRYFLGAGIEATAEDIKEQMFNHKRLVHIEGYMLNNGTLVEEAMKQARKAGAKISFDTASPEMAKEHKKRMLELISNYVDILFANEEEACALTGEGPEQSATLLKDLSPIAVVKMGEHGCWVAAGEEKLHHKAFKIQAVDTTGAGDLFASGFLHGHLRGKSLIECACYGNLLASQVVQVIGAEIPKDIWQLIRKQIQAATHQRGF